MKGLEILEKIPEMKSPLWVPLSIIICSFILIAATSFTWIMTKDRERTDKTTCIVGCICITYSLIIMILTMEGCLRIPTGEYEYIVNISDECSFNEVYKNYEIIQENNSGTYLIKERNQ